MKIQKIIFVFALISFLAVSCKNEAKKDNSDKKEEIAKKVEEASFNISGMTCEIGCAKTIASKLSKKEGVINAKVIFNDSTAVVKYDAAKTNKKDLIAFIDGIADGNTYKTSEVGNKKACKEECKKECSEKNETANKASISDCEKECCAKA